MIASSHSCAQPSACTCQSERNMSLQHYSFQSYLGLYGVKSPSHWELQNHHSGLLDGFQALPSDNYLPFKLQFKCFCSCLLLPKAFSPIAFFSLYKSLNYCPFKIKELVATISALRYHEPMETRFTSYWSLLIQYLYMWLKVLFDLELFLFIYKPWEEGHWEALNNTTVWGIKEN